MKALASALINLRPLSFSQKHNHTLCWVLCSSGVERNETADKWARKGSELDLQRVVEDISIPLNDMSVIAETNKRWSLTTKRQGLQSALAKSKFWKKKMSAWIQQWFLLELWRWRRNWGGRTPPLWMFCSPNILATTSLKTRDIRKKSHWWD